MSIIVYGRSERLTLVLSNSHYVDIGDIISSLVYGVHINDLLHNVVHEHQLHNIVYFFTLHMTSKDTLISILATSRLYWFSV